MSVPLLYPQIDGPRPGPLAILPPNADLWERAVAAAMDDGGLPVPLAEAFDPWRAPADFLPWLAAHNSVDLWFDDWPEGRKRLVIANAIEDAALKGTRAGSLRFLSYVDGVVLATIAFPHSFIIGRSAIRRTPLQVKPWVARYLVKVPSTARPRAAVAGRAVLGRSAIKAPSYEPFKRVTAALRASKGPETQYRVDFTHKRQIEIADAIPVDGTYYVGQWIDRTKF